MSKNSAQLKQAKLFARGDIIVYCLIALLIAGLFMGLWLGKREGALSGIDIVYTEGGEQIVFSYSFTTDRYVINESYADKVSVQQLDGSLRVTITYGNEYNVVVIDKSGSVSVTDADCSLHHDCTAMAPITDNNGVIVCVPHRLVIRPADYSGGSPLLGVIR